MFKRVVAVCEKNKWRTEINTLFALNITYLFLSQKKNKVAGNLNINSVMVRDLVPYTCTCVGFFCCK